VLELPLLTFDMDGVLCRPPFGINPGGSAKNSRTAAGKRDILWLTERWRYCFRRPMPGAVDGFGALQLEYRCVVVTARGEAARPLTERWFRHYFDEVPVIHMRPSWRERSGQFKARVIEELKPIAHCEDDAFTAAWVAELVDRVFVVDWPRNRSLEGSNITRIRTLREAADVLRGGTQS
jgi:hypothetical protein